jgi:hypothetical protein
MITLEQAELLHQELEAKGFRKLKGHYKRETYGYWKTQNFANQDEDKIGYQMAVLFYDWSKHPQMDKVDGKSIGLQYEFLILNNEEYDRFDFSVSGYKRNINDFEKMCQKMYKTILELDEFFSV